jgi:hypothetical protein
MRPVDRNAVAQLAAEQLVDRHAERLTLDVQEGVLDGGDRLAHHAAARLGRLGGQHRVVVSLRKEKVRQPASHLKIS